MVTVLSNPALALEAQVNSCSELSYTPVPFNSEAIYSINGIQISSFPIPLQPSNMPYIVEANLETTCGIQIRKDTFAINQPDHPEIMLSSPRACVGEVVLFQNLVPANQVSNLWSFGDGASSSLIKPSHFYTESGTYNVQLTIVNEFGCQSSDSIIINILPTPNSEFEIINPDCTLQPNTFINNSQGASNFIWNFGDGATSLDSTGIPVVHTFSNTGIFPIQLISINRTGCRDTATTIIEMTNSPSFLCDSLFQNSYKIPDFQFYAVDQEYTDTEGWTHYFKDAIISADTFIQRTILFSVKKNLVDIGNVGDNEFNVEILRKDQSFILSDSAILNPQVVFQKMPFGYHVKYRWRIKPNLTLPSSGVDEIGIRFYLPKDEIIQLDTFAPELNIELQDLIFYKVSGNNTGDFPCEDLRFINEPDIQFYQRGPRASTSSWREINQENHVIIEMCILDFSCGGFFVNTFQFEESITEKNCILFRIPY